MTSVQEDEESSLEKRWLKPQESLYGPGNFLLTLDYFNRCVKAADITELKRIFRVNNAICRSININYNPDEEDSGDNSMKKAIIIFRKVLKGEY